MSEEQLESRPVLPSFKHLADPNEWQRLTPTRTIPSEGDFVVLSINPVASVAHLDHAARNSAKDISTRKYLAVVYRSEALPMHSKPTNPYRLALVRRGLPKLFTPYDTVDMCIPIWPNTVHGQLREPLHPAHPLAWPDCYVDMTTYFPIMCRVTTAKRDYTPVLPLNVSSIVHMYHCYNVDGETRFDLQDRVMDGELDAIASLPLPPSPISAFRVPLPPSPPPSPIICYDGMDAHRATNPNDVTHDSTHADDVSVIASDDDDGIKDEDRASLSVLLAFEDLINNAGDVNDPVVDIWYDLDMISDVTDPSLLLDEMTEIKKVISDAEKRLGIERKTASPVQWSEIPPSTEQLPSRPASQKSNHSSISHTTPSLSFLQRVLMQLSSLSFRKLQFLPNVRAKVRRLVSTAGWTCHANSAAME